MRRHVVLADHVMTCTFASGTQYASRHSWPRACSLACKVAAEVADVVVIRITNCDSGTLRLAWNRGSGGFFEYA